MSKCFCSRGIAKGNYANEDRDQVWSRLGGREISWTPEFILAKSNKRL